MAALITFQEVCKYYRMGDSTVTAADRISFEIMEGEFTAIVGSSGSGKSTCMNIIGCLDVPSEGTYLLDGQDVGRMDRNRLAEIRNERLGFIFQQYNLLPKLNLLENVEVPLLYAGVPRPERRERARAALEQVGLEDKWRHRPMELSGGQQQRVLIARALCATEQMLILDEPVTGLDPSSIQEFYGLIRELNQRDHITIIMVSHDIRNVVSEAGKILHMQQRALFFGTAEDYAESGAGREFLGGKT